MKHTQPTLVVMAAGMGSRFGGLKQIQPVNDAGDLIIDFSLLDAWRAGFRDVVFVIKQEIEAEFKARIGSRMEKYFRVSYVYQQLEDLPAGFSVPEGRTKPWGTGHAVLSCRHVIDAPFAVINADDFYGRTAFSAIFDFLADNRDERCYTMIGYRVRNTVTEHGSVARGVCQVENGLLTGVTERTKIYKRGDDAAYTEDGENFVHLPGDTIVSMNMWGFTAGMLQELWNRFPAFLNKSLKENPLKCEYFLPSVVNAQLEDGSACVRVLPCEEAWYGVTYREDLDSVRHAIAAMKQRGVYKEDLWQMMDILAPVMERFAILGKPEDFDVYGFGHINNTHLVGTKCGKRYILQKINNHVFKDVPALMENVQAVTEFLREKNDDPRSTLSLVPTVDGKPYLFREEDHSYWRMYDFIEGSICLQQAETPADFYESAVAFGNFQEQLTQFPAETLHETIPNFHNTKDRYRIFRETLAKDPCGRAKEVQAEIDFALAREAEASTLIDLLTAGKLPLRVTHNDTKLNNVMLDAKTRKALCVIDLDTVMPGLSLYDFGDSIRFGAATAAEDEKDLSKVEMSLELFEMYTRGFLSACHGLTELEKEMLPMGAKLMTLECGVRFLTDYIDGDHYFSVHYDGQNLDRCRTQFKLVADMEQKWDAMHNIVREVSK